MKRRDFLKSSVAIASAAATTELLAAESGESGRSVAREFYELRKYHLRRGPMQKRFDDFYREAAIPAMNRAGISPIGVFSVMTGPDSPTMYVLLPHKSRRHLPERTTASARMPTIKKQERNLSMHRQPIPPMSEWRVRCCWPLKNMPKVEVPAKKGRMFELRTYESHSKKANKKKIEMLIRERSRLPPHGSDAGFFRRGINRFEHAKPDLYVGV